MAIKYEKIKEGMKLWQRGRQGMGNTTMTCEAWWDVRILELVPDGAMVSWNGNGKMWWGKYRLEKLFTEESREKILARQEAKRKAAMKR